MNRLGYTLLSLVVCGTATAQVANSVADGQHFRVVCHFDNEEVAAQALAAVEAVWTPTFEILSAGRHMPSRSRACLLSDPTETCGSSCRRVT